MDGDSIPLIFYEALTILNFIRRLFRNGEIVARLSGPLRLYEFLVGALNFNIFRPKISAKASIELNLIPFRSEIFITESIVS